MPSSPRGVRFLSGQRKRTRPYRWPTGRCWHRPLQKTCVFSVGGDALIAPWGTSPERSGKTDMAVPLATGQCGHRPLQRITCVFSVGCDAHIAPPGSASKRPEKNERAPSGVIPVQSMHRPLQSVIQNFPLLFSIQSHIFHFPSLRIGETVVK